jgi:hypothetical protein
MAQAKSSRGGAGLRRATPRHCSCDPAGRLTAGHFHDGLDQDRERGRASAVGSQLKRINRRIADHFHLDKVEVYWADKDLVLLTALSGIRGARPEIVFFQDAQADFNNELTWWAKYADKN